MYKVQPIVDSFDIQTPNCMFRMNPIYPHYRSGGTNKNSVEPTGAGGDNCNIDAIIKRQANVKQQLQDLQNQLKNLCVGWKINPSEVTSDTNDVCEVADLNDVVINASPKAIPYSLLCLKKSWASKIDLQVKCYTHSSIANVSQEARQFETDLAKENTKKVPVMKITLIWMNINETEMISPLTMYVPIYGEINILRYFSRVGPSNLRYDRISSATDQDSVLDACYVIAKSKDASLRSDRMKYLSQKLGKNNFFCGTTLSLADIGVYSTMKQLTNKKEVAQPIAKWLDQIVKQL